jgi:hypothetical protein
MASQSRRLAECGLVQLQQSVLLLDLRLVLLPALHDLAHDLGIEAVALGLGIDLADVRREGVLLAIQPLNAVEEGAQPVGCDRLGAQSAPRIVRATSSASEMAVRAPDSGSPISSNSERLSAVLPDVAGESGGG